MFRAGIVQIKMALLAFGLSAAASAAQVFPVKPVRLVVPFPPGSTTDIISRTVAQRLIERWGQQVVIDNRAGAGGVIGTQTVALAAADGYTLLVGSTATHAINPNLSKDVGYRPLGDFSPISLMATTPYLLVLNPSVSANSVKELIAQAKAKPGSLNYASGGNGSSPHLAAAIFVSMAGVDIQHVPYKGSAPAILDLLSGRVQILFTGIPSVLSHLKASRLKAIAVTSRNRTELLPQLPTVAESGVPGYDVNPWSGLMAPAKTPPAIVTQVNRDLSDVLKIPELRERLRAEGVELAGGSPRQFEEFIKAEMAKWGQAIKQSGMKVE